MKKISFILCTILCFCFLAPAFYVMGENTSKETFTVSYGKGIYISYLGSEPKNFIKGTPPESQEVLPGESVTVALNTFTFRDYSFGGWKYTYTDADGKKKAVYYNEGDVIENVGCDMTLEATWTRSNVDLKIDAYATYAHLNEKTIHYIGEVVVLKKAPSPPAENYEFCGWTDNEGKVLYSAGDKYVINNINTVIKPLWAKDGEKLDYRKITVTTTKGGTASVSKIFILSGTNYTIDLSADEGYYISDVKVDGVSKGNPSQVSVKAEDKDIIVNVEFKEIYIPNESTEAPDESQEKDEYSIKIFAEGKGSVSPSWDFCVKAGETAEIVFTPDKNYRLPLEITDNKKSQFFDISWDGRYTIENVQEDHEIKIFFVDQNSVLNPSIEDPSTNSNSSEPLVSNNFTKGFGVVLVVIASIFGALAVAYIGRNKKFQKRKTKRT